MKLVKFSLIITATALLLWGCAPDEPDHEPVGSTPYVRSSSTVRNDSATKSVITSQESYQLGTHIVISIYDENQASNEVFDAVFDEIYNYEQMISKNIDSTIVDQINVNAGVESVVVPEPLFKLIENALHFSEVSNGAFDVSIGPLVELWGIGTSDAAVPDPVSIDEAIAKVDFNKIHLDSDKMSVYLEEPDMIMDLGAIAKGYIADEVKQIILQHGYESAIVNLGGNVLMVGNKPNSVSWSVGVRNPLSESTSHLGILALNDNSIVTSGIYERFFEEDNVRYHHLINPRTGYPEQNELLAVSIISNESMIGDALSTAVFVMGLDKGYELVQSLENVEAIFILRDMRVIATPNIKSSFKLVNNDFVMEDYH